MSALVQRLLAASPNAAKADLDRLTSAALLAPLPVVSEDDAALVKAALYLHHGYLEECHRLCQQVATPNGSYWHGIMHRHERDLDNSRYWYQRVGTHPVLAAIGGYPRDKDTQQREFELLLAHTIKAATDAQSRSMSTKTIIAERKSRWRQFMANAEPPRHLFLIRIATDEPRPLLWRDHQRERIEWMTRSYEQSLARISWLADDSLPGFDLWTGTEIFAEAFGCELHRPDNDMPSARPLVHSATEAGRLKVPELSSSSLANLFEITDELRRRLGPNALMRLPDIQSPMDIAALIWDKSDFYVALVETPEAVRELVAKVRTLLTAFLDEWFRRYGREFIAHYPGYYMERGLTLSEDEVGAVSAEVFDEFFLPELTHLSERYGGIGIHCCANARHQWPGFLKVPGLQCLNIVHNPAMIRDARQVFSHKCAQMHSWNGDGDPLTWPAQFPPRSRLIVEVGVKTPDEAKRLAEAMATAYRR